MISVNEVKLNYQQDTEINKGLLTISFNENTYISFDVNIDDLRKSEILDYDGLTINKSMHEYYLDMMYQIMNSKVFEYFHYN